MARLPAPPVVTQDEAGEQDARRPTALVVVSSSCQLFSGTGVALFDWMRVARHAIAFSLLIDTGEPVSFSIASRFCRDNGIELIVSTAEQVPGCPDRRPDAIARVLQTRHWDLVECLSWANAATNMDVLHNRPEGSRLIFTPHTQPIWTLPGPERFFMVSPVFEAMLGASDLVLVDTPEELSHVPPALIAKAQVAFVPLGVDTGRFCPDPDTRRSASPARVLTVADFREHRKRPDLLIQALDALCRVERSAVPVLVGRDSDTQTLPPLLAARAEILGFVSAAELLRQYQAAGVFLLLSDFEAFGLPIAEALCCGTPVVINRQRETAMVFGDLPGVTLVSNSDPGAVRDGLLAAIATPPDRARIAAAAGERFGAARTYGRKLDLVMALLGRPALA